MNDTYNNLETNEAQCLQQIPINSTNQTNNDAGNGEPPCTDIQENAQTNDVKDEETTAFCINM